MVAMMNMLNILEGGHDVYRVDTMDATKGRMRSLVPPVEKLTPDETVTKFFGETAKFTQCYDDPGCNR